MSLRLLLVEDSAYKRGRVVELLRDAFPGTEIVEAFSFNGGARALDGGQFAVAVLDMSLPTYDRDGPQGGGRFRTFGGREIARKLVRRNSSTRIVFLTQYESFSDRSTSVSLDQLKEELKKEGGQNYFGTVYYDSAHSQWKTELVRAIRSAINANTDR